MKTLRTYTLLFEVAGLCIILIMSLLVYVQIRDGIIDSIIEEQNAQIGEIEQYLELQFDMNLEAFGIFSDAVESGHVTDNGYSIALSYLQDFSDIYTIDANDEIVEIIKKEEGSIIFEGYNLSKGELIEFIHGVTEGETKLSHILRSPERDTVSAYVVRRESNGALVGRLNLNDIKEIMLTIANARGIDISIASNNGYVLSSTASTLPFEIVPAVDGYQVLGNKAYIVIHEEIDWLGNDMVLLVPFEQVSQIFRLFEVSYPIFIGAFSFLILLKVAFYTRVVTEPLSQFAERLESWNGDGLAPIDSALKQGSDKVLNTLELRRISDVFAQKSAEINAYIEALGALNAEIKVRESLYKDLVENVDEIIYSLDPEGNITSINKAFEVLLERDRTFMIGKSMTYLASKDNQEEMIRQKFKYIKEFHDKVTFNYRATDVHKNVRYFKITWIPQLDDFGNLVQIIGTQTEITELINAQASLRRLHEAEKRKLESMVDEKSEALTNVLDELIEKEKLASLGHLVSGVSHEINTPLGVSVLANSYLEKESKDTHRKLESGTLTLEDLQAHLAKVDETTAILRTNLSRAVALVKSFKEIAVRQNIEAMETFNVRDYIDMIMLSLKHEYKSRPIVFDIDCPPELTLYTYPGALSQILTNLVMNALNHAYERHEKGTISISLSAKDSTATLVFEDDGKGMTQEVAERIFEPFFTTNRGKGGSGLGMNIVYNIVTGQLNGRIKCESVPGKGTRFEIEFAATVQ